MPCQQVINMAKSVEGEIVHVIEQVPSNSIKSNSNLYRPDINREGYYIQATDVSNDEIRQLREIFKPAYINKELSAKYCGFYTIKTFALLKRSAISFPRLYHGKNVMK